MAALTVKSPAKLNLYLNVRGKRGDGYHEIETIFERIDLSDEIKFFPDKDEKIKLFCNNAEVPLGPGSLIYNCVELLRKELKHPKGIVINIDKHIPVASGLAGGSSNAASIILGLNKFWRLNLSKQKLLRIGRTLGADICFFLYNKPLGIGRGRGDRITPLPRPGKPLRHILVIPRQKVFSGEAYSKLKFCGGLTEPQNGIKIVTSALRKGDLALLRSSLYNSLEKVVAESCPAVKKIRRTLASWGLQKTLISGSGPAVFGLTKNKKEAMQLKKELDSKHRNWRIFVVSTY